jgi:hypothetical protein
VAELAGDAIIRVGFVIELNRLFIGGAGSRVGDQQHQGEQHNHQPRSRSANEKPLPE